MKKSLGSMALIIAFVAGIGILPAMATSSCGLTFNVVPGEVVTLEAKPDTPVGSWIYLWDGTGYQGGSTHEHDDLITFTAPAYIEGGTNTYCIDLTVSNDELHSCNSLCHICFEVKKEKCPLTDTDACDQSLPTTTDLSYTGLTQTYYKYHWIAKGAGVGGADLPLKEMLNDPIYILDWSKLKQPSSTATEVCTTIEFYITVPPSTTQLQKCSASYCISFKPTADIGVSG